MRALVTAMRFLVRKLSVRLRIATAGQVSVVTARSARHESIVTSYRWGDGAGTRQVEGSAYLGRLLVSPSVRQLIWALAGVMGPPIARLASRSRLGWIFVTRALVDLLEGSFETVGITVAPPVVSAWYVRVSFVALQEVEHARS